jgi:hypothetical protein
MNVHFIHFDILSHTKIFDIDMLTSTSTFIILREEYCSTIIAEDIDWSRYRIDDFETVLIFFIFYLCESLCQ